MKALTACLITVSTSTIATCTYLERFSIGIPLFALYGFIFAHYLIGKNIQKRWLGLISCLPSLPMLYAGWWRGDREILLSIPIAFICADILYLRSPFQLSNAKT